MKFRTQNGNLIFKDCLEVRQSGGFLIIAPGQYVGMGGGDIIWGIGNPNPTKEHLIDSLRSFKKAYPKYKSYRIIAHPICDVGIL